MYVDELVEAASASNIEAITRLLDRGVPVDGFHSTTVYFFVGIGGIQNFIVFRESMWM